MKGNLLRVGPATILALGGAIALAYVRFPQWQREAQTQRELDAARAQIAEGPRAKALLPATLDTLWNQRKALQLSAPQMETLKALRAAEERQTAMLKREVEDRQRVFSTWMKAHQNGAALRDIQAQATPYSAASAELTRKRRGFWNRALLILNSAQRAQIETKTQVETRTQVETKAQVNP